MDNIYEHTVHRRHTVKTLAYKALILLCAAAIPVIIAAVGVITQVYYCFVVAAFSVLLCIYGVWFFWTSLKIDYEYSVISGELAICKIIDNRKRKDLLKLDLHRVEKIEKYVPALHDGNAYEKVYDYCGEYEDCTAVFFKSAKQKGECMLLFSPDEKMLNYMLRIIRRNIVK